MAIVFDNAAFCGDGNGLTVSKNFTIGSGADRIVFVWVYCESTTPTVTFGGVAMTHLNNGNQHVPGFLEVSNWYMINPPTGSQSISVTTGAVTFKSIGAASYFNVSDYNAVGQGSANVATGDTSVTANITTGSDNSWVVAGGTGSATGSITPNAGTNILVDANDSAGFKFIICDSNGPITPAGATSLGFSWSGGAASFGVDADAFGPSFSGINYLNIL